MSIQIQYEAAFSKSIYDAFTGDRILCKCLFSVKVQQESISTRKQEYWSLDKMAYMALTGDEKHNVLIILRNLFLKNPLHTSYIVISTSVSIWE